MISSFLFLLFPFPHFFFIFYSSLLPMPKIALSIFSCIRMVRTKSRGIGCDKDNKAGLRDESLRTFYLIVFPQNVMISIVCENSSVHHKILSSHIVAKLLKLSLNWHRLCSIPSSLQEDIFNQTLSMSPKYSSLISKINLSDLFFYFNNSQNFSSTSIWSCNKFHYQIKIYNGKVRGDHMRRHPILAPL